MIYKTSCYAICSTKDIQCFSSSYQRRPVILKDQFLDILLNLFGCARLLCNSPPLNSMMTFWKNTQNKQIKVFNSNNAFLLSFFILGRLTNRHKKEVEIRTLCKIDFKEEAYSFPGIVPKARISVNITQVVLLKMFNFLPILDMYGVLTFERSSSRSYGGRIKVYMSIWSIIFMFGHSVLKFSTGYNLFDYRSFKFSAYL